MFSVSDSTMGKSCAVQESLCKQRIHRERPSYFSGTRLACNQNVTEHVGNVPSASMCRLVVFTVSG